MERLLALLQITSVCALLPFKVQQCHLLILQVGQQQAMGKLELSFSQNGVNRS